MDYVDIQDALDVLLTEVMEELKALRPDIMIEFRQKYIGPQIRKYGNFLRVADCPASGLSNRLGTIDLRLLSGDTAIHSDMLMWHKDEKPEDAALQVLSCIFATVQISLNLADVSEEVEKMLKFWMAFMKEHMMLLQCAQIQPLEPENLYPEVRVENDNTRIQVNYSKGRVVNLCSIPEEFYYIHGTKADEVVFKMNGSEALQYVVVDCMGNELEAGIFANEKWGELSVPTSGMVIVRK
jgi:alpha-galactosidase